MSNGLPVHAEAGASFERSETGAVLWDEGRRNPPQPLQDPDDAPAGYAERMSEFAGFRGTVIGIPISALLWLLIYLAVRFLAG
ncbi:hypothetical protein [Sphingomonas sp. dw_22]|uniref:hypothetical protein n=1 Tax=Sphingomonas sp. dw_22 TaxID=2721175 RepID=UPI001BD2131D|nr:hypothetical protein [Sphingomonas sp. dw_22]